MLIRFQRSQAINRTLARALNENQAGPVAQRLSPAALRRFAENLTYSHMDGDTRVNFQRRLQDTVGLTAPGTEAQALVRIIREEMQDIAGRGAGMTEGDLTQLQGSIGELFTGKLSEAQITARIAAEIATPSALPGMPAAPAMTSRVLSLQWVNGYNAAMAEMLDNNLSTTANPRLTADQVQAFALSLVRNGDDFREYQTQFWSIADNLRDRPEDRLRAVTRLTRQMLQRTSEDYSLGRESNISIATMQQSAITHFQSRIPTTDALNEMVTRKIATPPASLPAIPAMPTGGGSDTRERVGRPPPQLGTPARMESAINDLITARTPGGGWDTRSRSTILGTLKPDGVREVTFSFSRSASPESRAAARLAFAEISRAANIRFVEDTSASAWQNANIVIGEEDARWFAHYPRGTMGRGQTEGNSRSVIIRNDVRGTQLNGLMVHEVMHTLGIHHPGAAAGDNSPDAGGTTREYSTRGTAMTYNGEGVGWRYGSIGPHLGPYDIAALRRLYGAARGQPAIRTYTPADLAGTWTVHAPTAARLDFRGTEFIGGSVTVNMSTNVFDEQIFGQLQRNAGQNSIGFSPSIMPGTNVEVLVNPNSPIQFFMTGREGVQLQGGTRDDTLVASGGANRLTGGGGADAFVFTPTSGRDNIITDFNVAENDRIVIMPGFSRVNLRQVNNGGPNFDQRGTTIRMMDGDREVSSVFVANATPAQVQSRLTMVASDSAPAPRVVTHLPVDLMAPMLTVNLPGGGTRMVLLIPPSNQLRIARTGSGLGTVTIPPGDPDYDWDRVEREHESLIYRALIPEGENTLPANRAAHYNSEVERLVGRPPRFVTVPKPAPEKTTPPPAKPEQTGLLTPVWTPGMPAIGGTDRIV